MRSFPRVHRRVLGSWLCLLFLLSIVFHDTGDESPTTALIPFLSSISLVLSHGATIFLVPDLVLASSTLPPTIQQHPTPVSASHYSNPPQGRWLVSYITTFDDQTLYNIAIRRPLNGTGKLVTRKDVNWIAPDEFVGAPTTGEDDAEIEYQIYSTPIALGLIGFPGLELGTQVDDLQLFGTPSDRGHGVLKPATILPFTKILQLVVEPSGSEAPTRTWREALEQYPFVGILALAVAAYLIFLAADTIEPMIVKTVDNYHSAFVTTREVVLEVQAGPLDLSPNVDSNHPAVLPSLRSLAHSPITLATTLEVAGNPDSVPVNEETEKEDSPALNPSAPNSSGFALSAQVSGPMPDAGSFGAPKLDDSSCSVRLATVERLRAILCTDIPSSTSQPSEPHDSGAGLTAQVSGTASKTVSLGKLFEVEATVPSARQSRMVVQANLDRIENANRKGRSRGRKHGGITIARQRPALLDTITEDLEDSIVSSDAPTVVAVSSSSIPPLATTNTTVEQPTDADDHHPLREARAAEGAVENKENMLKKVVTFLEEVHVRDLPMSKWDWEARRKFQSESKEREIEDEYHVWAKGKPTMKRKRGGESFYGLSGDEWNMLGKYQRVRSNPKEVVRSRPETAAVNVDGDVVFQFTFTVPVENRLIDPSHSTLPVVWNSQTGLYYNVVYSPPWI